MTTKRNSATPKTKRNVNRKMLHQARNMALVRGDVEENIDPVDAFQYVLDRAFHMLKNAEAGVSDLKPEEIWRDTMVGRIPNEWIRLEEDLRHEVFSLSSKMMSLNLDDRKTRATEIMAAIIGPVIKELLDRLELTPDQERRAPEVVASSLRLLEGGRADRDEEAADG